MFLGQYEHSIDEKGRTIIPVRFREVISEGAYITQGFDQNLVVLPASTFHKIYERVNQMSMTNPAARQFRRLFFAHADQIEVDRTGRMLIPQFLRNAAHLQNAAVIVGTGDNFEIWSPELWNQQNEALQDREANAERFAELDLSFNT